MGPNINCQCTNCNCQENFEILDGEELLNLIQHGRLTSEQISFLKNRVGSKLCKQCFHGNHHK